MTFRAGRLNKRVSIERSVPTQDTYGEPVDAWELIGVRWAAVKHRGGGERDLSNAVTLAVYTHEFELRKDRITRTIDTSFRLGMDGKLFLVESAEDIYEADERVTVNTVQVTD